jgi:hypothetical protein
MAPTAVTRHDMVDGQDGRPLPAVLARELITPEDLTLGELDSRVRTLNHVRKPDDGWAWEHCRGSPNLASTI